MQEVAPQKKTDQREQPVHLNRELILLAPLAALGSFIFGYDTSAISASLIQITNPNTSPTCPGLADHRLGTFTSESITSISVLVATLGAFCAGYLNDHIGRRGVLRLSSLTFALGAILMALAQSVPMLLVARSLAGLAIGASSHTAPCYISECSPVTIRGGMVMIMMVMVAVGQTVGAAVSTLIFFIEVHDGWRWILGAEIIPAAFMLAGTFLLPESPRWLLSIDRPEMAKCVLRTLRRGVADDIVEEEYLTMYEGVTEELRSIPSSPPDELVTSTVWRVYWQDLHVRRALMLGCGLQLVAQWLGISAVMYYGTEVLSMSSPVNSVHGCFSNITKRSVALNILLSVGQAIGILTSWMLVDRFGRRKLFLSALVGSIFGLCCVGIAFTANHVSVTVVIIFIIAFVIMFGSGISGTPWVVNAEIYPLHVRAQCIAAATATNWIANFSCSDSFLSLAKFLSSSTSDPTNHPNGVFFLYATVGLVSYIILYYKMPETKGLSLERTRDLFVSPEEKSLL